VFDSPTNDKTLARFNFEILIATTDLQMARHDVNDLIVWVAVTSTDPSFFHTVFREE
jgi:hypothetical protein